MSTVPATQGKTPATTKPAKVRMTQRRRLNKAIAKRIEEKLRRECPEFDVVSMMADHAIAITGIAEDKSPEDDGYAMAHANALTAWEKLGKYLAPTYRAIEYDPRAEEGEQGTAPNIMRLVPVRSSNADDGKSLGPAPNSGENPQNGSEDHSGVSEAGFVTPQD